MRICARRLLLAGILLPILSGCGHAFMDRQYVRAMGAAQLEGRYKISGTTYSAADILAAPEAATSGASPAGVIPGSVMSAWLGAGGVDSKTKCNEFIARLAVQQTSWDTGLDIAALAMSGAAAVAVLPVTTAAALAAGSTFATGTRALIDSDIYGKLGADLIASEIRQDYDPALRAYMKHINVSRKDDFTVQLAELMQTHEVCSLQTALKNLRQKSAGVPPRPPLIAASSLKDKQTYALIEGGRVTLAVDADKVTLKGYTGTPTVSREAATAILNASQAVLEPE